MNLLTEKGLILASQSKESIIIIVQAAWEPRIKNSECYEWSYNGFSCLDVSAISIQQSLRSGFIALGPPIWHTVFSVMIIIIDRLPKIVSPSDCRAYRIIVIYNLVRMYHHHHHGNPKIIWILYKPDLALSYQSFSIYRL